MINSRTAFGVVGAVWCLGVCGQASASARLFLVLHDVHHQGVAGSNLSVHAPAGVTLAIDVLLENSPVNVKGFNVVLSCTAPFSGGGSADPVGSPEIEQSHNNPTYVFNGITNFPAVDEDCSEEGGPRIAAGLPVNSPGVPVTDAEYLGTFYYEISGQASGSAKIDFLPVTFLRDSNLDLIPVIMDGLQVTIGPADLDSDGADDFGEDNCPNLYNPDQSDGDGDGVGDDCDNCLIDYNSMQSDADQDSIGDVCDDCPNLVGPTGCEMGGSAGVEVDAAVGGVVATESGAVELNIEPGDLMSDETITIMTTVPSDPSASILAGAESDAGTVPCGVYFFGPNGLLFESPVTLTISCDVSGLTPEQRELMQIYLYSDFDLAYVPLASDCTTAETPRGSGVFIATCTAEVAHFSEYAPVAPADADNDGVIDDFGGFIDNCPEVANPGQEDSNANGIGDACACVGDAACSHLHISACGCAQCSDDVCSTVPIAYGNVNCAGPANQVNLDDILCTIQGFANFGNCPNSDISPCSGNQVINLDDLLAVLSAFGGSNPCGCTP